MVFRATLYILLFLCLHVFVKSAIVYTKSGFLNGTVLELDQARKVYVFLGVPYAEPPTGERRFKEPQPLSSKWEGIRSAQKNSPSCIQYRYYFNRKSGDTVGDEDCLYVNIYSSSLSNDSNLDVVVFFHGGGFMFGSGNAYSGDFIFAKVDIVFVTVNYRLGPFGFLSTEDEVIPGNNGLKDQVQALIWIQENIEHFGGDKSKVTITGLSAGGASVHLHYLSPLSKHLFSRGISVSGSAFCPWVFAENSRMKAFMLADAVQCPTDDSRHLLECLRQRPAKSILLHLEELFMPWHFNPFSPFGVVVENSSNVAFLSKHPHELLSERNIKDAPWLTSITSEEGLYPAATFITHNELLHELEENWNEISPYILDYNYTTSIYEKDNLSQRIKEFYLGNNTIDFDHRGDLLRMMSDRLFIVDIERGARLQAAATKSPVYFYEFTYRGKYSISNLFCSCRDNLGVSHADDLLYLLKMGAGLSPLETDEDKEMVDIMVNIWTSFIRTGVPSLELQVPWIPVSPTGDLSYLRISSSQNITLVSSASLGSREFWDSLPFNEPKSFEKSGCGEIGISFPIFIIFFSVYILGKFYTFKTLV
uniref:Carboxylic ester hydrolase n=1 Tax=Graphocephala atropunctata TaxID=36148 RepID=A0A1B6M112_9HEMI